MINGGGCVGIRELGLTEVLQSQTALHEDPL